MPQNIPRIIFLVAAVIVGLIWGTATASAQKPPHPFPQNQPGHDEADRETAVSFSDTPDQEAGPSDRKQKDEKKKNMAASLRVELLGGTISPARVKDSHGEFSSSYCGFTLGFNMFQFRYTQHLYSWEDVHDLAFGNGLDDPWEELHHMSLGGQHHRMINQRWGYFIHGSLAQGFEKEWGSINVFASSGAIYQLSPNWRINLGALVTYHRIRTLVLPAFGISYGSPFPMGPPKPGWFASIGIPVTTLGYRFNPALSLRAFGMLDRRPYRLADDNKIDPKGYVDFMDIITGLFLEVSPARNMRLTLGGGYVCARHFWFYNKDGHEQGHYQVDPGGMGLARIFFLF